MSDWVFQPDVRLVSSRDGKRTGLQRGLRVLWFQSLIGHYVWQHGPLSLGTQLAETLAQHGFSTNTISASRDDIDRNLVFARALTSTEKGIDAQLPDMNFVILGCGGLGSNVAIQLASLGAKNLILVDGDTIQKSNLNRLFWATQRDVGSYKTDCLSTFLCEHFDVQVRNFRKFVGRDIFLQEILLGLSSTFLVLAGDSTRDLRIVLTNLYRLTSDGNDLPRHIHAGYIGRYCMVGPVINKSIDPCPFCYAEATILDDSSFVAPSAAPNNAIIAGIVCSQILIDLLNNNSVLRKHRWVFDISTCESNLNLIEKDANCQVCQLL